MSPRASLLFLSLALGACQTVGANGDQPARIVDSSPASVAALKAALKDALGVDVMVSESALADSSILSIERLPTGTMDNRVPDGRNPGRPVQFRLVRNGDQCVLIRQDDDSRYPLPNTRCEAE